MNDYRKKEDFLFEPNRIIEISDALRGLHKNCVLYLEKFEKSSNSKAGN